MEGAGIVEAIGPDVEGVEVGQRVAYVMLDLAARLDRVGDRPGEGASRALRAIDPYHDPTGVSAGSIHGPGDDGNRTGGLVKELRGDAAQIVGRPPHVAV